MLFIRRHLAALVALILSVTVVSSCSDTPNEPTPPSPDAALIADLTNSLTSVTGPVTSLLDLVVTGLVECNVTQSYSAQKEIGPEGGLLRVGPHSLMVPRGALTQRVTISAFAPAGKHVRVDFAPEGLEFRRKTALSLSYASCGVLKPLQLNVVYVDYSGGQFTIREVLPTLTNLFSRTVLAPVDHFSGYMLAD